LPHSKEIFIVSESSSHKKEVLPQGEELVRRLMDLIEIFSPTTPVIEKLIEHTQNTLNACDENTTASRTKIHILDSLVYRLRTADRKARAMENETP
jgi:hypothetical protein